MQTGLVVKGAWGTLGRGCVCPTAQPQGDCEQGEEDTEVG